MICIEESADGGIVVAGLEVVEPGLLAFGIAIGAKSRAKTEIHFDLKNSKNPVFHTALR